MSAAAPPPPPFLVPQMGESVTVTASNSSSKTDPCAASPGLDPWANHGKWKDTQWQHVECKQSKRLDWVGEQTGSSGRSTQELKAEERKPEPVVVYKNSVEWARRPVQEGATVQCTIRRKKSMFGSSASYYMTASHDGTFLMAARRRKKSKTANYFICLDADDINKDNANNIAKVRAKDGVVTAGSQYVTYNLDNNSQEKTQAALIEFEPKKLYHRITGQDPVRLSVCVPRDVRSDDAIPILNDFYRHIHIWSCSSTIRALCT